MSCKIAKAEAKSAEVAPDDRLSWSYVAVEERPSMLYHLDNDDSDEDGEDTQSGSLEDSDSDGT